MEPSRASRAPLRTACARCHAQKLRCPGRQENEQGCGRCVKAGAACVFGLSVRGKRPAAVAAQGFRTASEMDKDFPTAKRIHRPLSTGTRGQTADQPHDGDDDVAEVTEQFPPPPPTMAAAAADTIVADSHHLVSDMQVVENLCQLNVDLLRHAKAIPPLNGEPPDVTRDYETFRLDEIFRLTVAFLDVVRALQLQGGGGLAVDTATLFLVMACWRRLADMYDSLFSLVRRCADRSVLPATRGGSPVTLPSVSIGSFAPDATTSTLLQMIAILQHSTQLANDMSGFAARMSSHELTYADLQSRMGNLHQQVRSIKSMLAQTGLF